MGWSLGAQIAIRMAHGDNRIQALMLVTVNPKFAISEDWPHAMSLDLLLNFEKNYASSASKTLRRFASLQAQGSDKPKFLVAHMTQLMSVKVAKIGGLKLLQALDERALLSQLSQPCCIQLAKDDELVPCAWIRHMQLPGHVEIN